MELIKISKNDNGIKTVNARELYEFLGYDKTQWSRWSKKNIEDDSFFDNNVDYVALDIMSNGNKTKDYHISIDMAKELSMLARNDKGKQARIYFIECENQLKDKLPKTYGQALIEAGRLAIENETLQLENETMKPKAIEYDKFMSSDDAQPMGDVAKLFKIGKNKLFEKLRNDKILMKNNTPYQKYMKYFVVIEKVVNDKFNTTVTLVNSKGIDYISNRYFKGVE